MSSSLTCEIRPFEKADRQGLIDTINLLCAEEGWMKTSLYQPTPSWEHVLNWPSCNCHLLLVAYNHQIVVGWCRAFATGQPSDVEIGIGLLPIYRNKGLGSEMLRQAIAWAERQGLSRLVLTTQLDNSRAFRTFKKCGFKLIGRVGDEWLRMEHKLNNVEARSQTCEK